MEALSWTITFLLGCWLIAFALALLSLRAIPLDERPRTATYDRFGRFLGLRENPDYHEQPGEDRAATDDA
jgi:hypothetical protein